MCLSQHLAASGTWYQYLGMTLITYFKLLSAEIVHCRLSFLPLLLINILEEILWDYAVILFLLTLSLIYFSIHWWILPARIVTVPYQLFSLSLIPSIFINWNSSVRNSCSFSTVSFSVYLYQYRFMDIYFILWDRCSNGFNFAVGNYCLIQFSTAGFIHLFLVCNLLFQLVTFYFLSNENIDFHYLWYICLFVPPLWHIKYFQNFEHMPLWETNLLTRGRCFVYSYFCL